MLTDGIIYKAERLPVLQNRLYNTRLEACASPMGNVELRQDSGTGVVTNVAFDPEAVVYDENYNNEQGRSAAFRAHLAEVADLIQGIFHKRNVIEIGCGKGLFLELLRERGLHVRGIDPAYEGDDPMVEKCYFEASRRLGAEGIVLRHVLEHIPKPLDFLQKIRRANDGKGKIYIEVPCFDWICRNKTWFDIFYEHVNYFTAEDFKRFFEVPPIIKTSFCGQYLSVVADLSTLRSADDLTPVKRWVCPAHEFGKAIAKDADHLKLLRGSNMGKLVVWGAASKGVVYSLQMIRAGVAIDFLVDIDECKQGRYVPISGLRVEPPSRLFEDTSLSALVLVMNSNYLDEVREMIPTHHYCIGV